MRSTGGMSLVVLASLVTVATATPHPECEPCAAALPAEFEALVIANKYLCCDLTCETNPVAGCGVFGLPLVCKACYEGDTTPAYDDEPVTDDSGSSSGTAAPVEEGGTPPTLPPTTPSPSFTMPTGTDGPTPVPFSMPTRSSPAPAATGSTSASDGCTACDSADDVLTPADFEALEMAGKALVCNPECATASLVGCGAFGLPNECQVVYVATSASSGGSSSGSTDDSTTSPTTSSVGSGSSSGSSTSPTPSPEGSGSSSSSSSISTSSIPSPGGSGSGSGSSSSSSTSSSPSPEGSGSGSGSGGSSAPTPSPEGSVGGGSSSGSYPGVSSCSSEDTAACAELSPAQVEALAMYDNGGKKIVCDPTCEGDNPIHCNYFGLGQKCRGCGTCTDCTPCP